MDQVRIRPASESDLDAINRIYNHYVQRSTCTYQLEPETAEDRRLWFQNRGPKHPVTVAVRGAEVVGWGSLSRFHARAAYRFTVENSIYVRHDCQHQGVGTAILLQLIELARTARHHAIIALISADQEGSIRLHERHSFKKVAHLQEIGFKFGKWLDVVYLQRLI